MVAKDYAPVFKSLLHLRENLMIDQLKLYHGLGIPLVFLQPKTKIPLQKNWSRTGFDAGQLSHYREGMNVGIKLGWPLSCGHYLGAIDVDIANEGYAAEVWALMDAVAPNYRLWPKVTSGRGNGSGHYYFLSKTPITSRTLGSSKGSSTKAWEVSLMGAGRQCVAPPSVHPSGAIYAWETDIAFLSVETLGTPVVQDALTDLPIADELRRTIRLAKTKDRSAALFNAVTALLRAKVPEDKITEIMTDRRFLLAHVPYEHTGSSDPGKATAWFVKYMLEPAKERVISKDVTLDKSGNIANTYRNAQIVLCEKIFGKEPFIRHNAFRNSFEWCQVPPWADTIPGRSAGKEDALLACDYMLEVYGVRFHTNTVDELLTTEAMKNTYHPVKDYLDSLTWDGVPRIATMFQTYHRSQMHPSYLAEVAHLWMVGAVARIYEPGVKFDYTWVLEGVQGIGKSTFLLTLASKEWFLDSLPNLADKDAATNIQGAWICEIAELSAMNRSTIDAVKAYMSRDTDRVRPPYGQRRIDFPRSTMFAGTTNLRHYLHDPTGARRFWPIEVGKLEFKALKADRDQLWAEAAFYYHYHRPAFYPSFELESHLKRLHSLRRVDDEGDEARALLASWVATNDQVPSMTLSEMFSCGPLMAMKRTRTTDLRVSAILEDLGFELQHINGLRYWVYGGYSDDTGY